MVTGSAPLGPLSPRQSRALDFIRSFTVTHGYPPTVREVGAAVGLRGSSAATYQIKQLEAKGYLRRAPDRPRAIVISEPAKPCPHCGVTS